MIVWSVAKSGRVQHARRLQMLDLQATFLPMRANREADSTALCGRQPVNDWPSCYRKPLATPRLCPDCEVLADGP